VRLRGVIDPPTSEDVVRAGGWDSRSARVLAIATDRDIGVAVIDVNGDGSTVEVDELQWHDGVWAAGGGTSGWGSGRTQTMAFTSGPATSGTEVTVSFAGTYFTTTAGPTGWWAFARKIGTGDSEWGMPEVVAERAL
jgi:hypothetical protein